MTELHDRFLDLAAAAIDFDVAPAERAELDRHLATCGACRLQAAAFRDDAAAIGELPRLVLAPRRTGGIRWRGSPAQTTGLGSIRLVAAAAVLTLLALGALAVGAELLRRERGPDLITTIAPSLPPAGPAVRPSSIDIAAAWQPVPQPAQFESVLLQELVAGPTGGLVAFGCRISIPDGSCTDVASWSSPNGLAWSEPHILPNDGFAFAEVTTALRFGDDLLAAGALQLDDFSGAVWRSRDGEAWSQAVADLDGVIRHLVPYRDALVAIGDRPGEVSAFVAWWSPDGSAWAKTADIAGFEPRGVMDPGDGSVLVWAVDDAGRLVWMQTNDGTAWREVTAPAGLDGVQPRVVETVAAGLVLYGNMEDSHASERWFRAWSDDTYRVMSEPWPFGIAHVAAALPIGHGRVVVATTDDGSQIWYDDGAGWRRAGEAPGAFPVALVQHPIQLDRLYLLNGQGGELPWLWSGSVDWAS